MTFPHSPQPGPRPGPPPGGFRPGPPSQPGGYHPAPQPGPQNPAPAAPSQGWDEPDDGRDPEDTGHPAVDAALRSLANAARLAPGEQIAAYEAAHQVLQETLASIDR
ncbi:hypothetical protein [Paractinoplanes rishiriensis]|uniref:Uncharacterized protein n=1 Tax=Paractinoplanes rishiriensis TaxID=1050105 RepID=A0A919MV24_9ACTN|nr:hypothetical protein [Actinoplanes rishiriensis]GIF00942.1 hypothetical protein Ari01nite_84060 [Actinoplanes rishiriensis]